MGVWTHRSSGYPWVTGTADHSGEFRPLPAIVYHRVQVAQRLQAT